MIDDIEGIARAQAMISLEESINDKKSVWCTVYLTTFKLQTPVLLWQEKQN